MSDNTTTAPADEPRKSEGSTNTQANTNTDVNMSEFEAMKAELAKLKAEQVKTVAAQEEADRLSRMEEFRAEMERIKTLTGQEAVDAMTALENRMAGGTATGSLETLTKTQILGGALGSPEEVVSKYGGSKSAAIRALAAQGLPRARIADALKIRYQHVRQVLEQPLKRRG